jgi:hypothetical protein
VGKEVTLRGVDNRVGRAELTRRAIDGRVSYHKRHNPIAPMRNRNAACAAQANCLNQTIHACGVARQFYMTAAARGGDAHVGD